MSNKPTVLWSSEKIKQTICRRSSEGGMSTCLIGDTMIQKSANHYGTPTKIISISDMGQDV